MHNFLLVMWAIFSVLVAAQWWAMPVVFVLHGMAFLFFLATFVIYVLVGLALLVYSTFKLRPLFFVYVMVVPLIAGASFFAFDRLGLTPFRVYFSIAQHSTYKALVDAASKSQNDTVLAWAWGETGGDFGGNIVAYTLVYDPSGTIARPRDQWPSGWKDRAAKMPSHGMGLLLDPTEIGPIQVEPVGDNFYLISQELV